MTKKKFICLPEFLVLPEISLLHRIASEHDVIVSRCYFEKSRKRNTVQVEFKQSSKRVAVFLKNINK